MNQDSSNNEDGSAMSSESVHDAQSSEVKQLMKIKPTIKPNLIQLGLTLAISLVVIAILYDNPELLGTVEATNIALIFVQIVLVILVIRIAIQVLIIRSTVYTITDQQVRREYRLLGRNKSREVPYNLVRSVGYSQDRIENLLNIGTISLNEGLGDLELTSIPSSDEAYNIIQEQIKHNR